MREGIRHADGLQLVIETEPLAGSVLQIHADIWSAFVCDRERTCEELW